MFVKEIINSKNWNLTTRFLCTIVHMYQNHSRRKIYITMAFLKIQETLISIMKLYVAD